MGKKLRLSFRGTSDIQAIIRHYIPSGTYTRVSTSSTVRVESETVCLIWSPSYVGEGLLRILGQVKGHVRKRFREGLVAKVDHKPRYESVGSIGRAARAVELDLSSAYLSAAYKIGAISPQVKDRLSKVSKHSRLMTLGCLASRATVQEYVAWAKVSTAAKYDVETGEVWTRIVAEVDRTMQELAKSAGRQFLYYWCDAVFVEPSAAEEVERKAAILGYHMKKKAVIMGVFGKMSRYIGVNDGRKFSLRKRAAT